MCTYLESMCITVGPNLLYFYQVLVYHDLLGFMQHPHHAKMTPKFCKQFGQVGENIQDALTTYKKEVESREFPGIQYSPYKIKAEELEEFTRELDKEGLSRSKRTSALPTSNKPESKQTSWIDYFRGRITSK